jgi:hypothetical protein
VAANFLVVTILFNFRFFFFFSDRALSFFLYTLHSSNFKTGNTQQHLDVVICNTDSEFSWAFGGLLQHLIHELFSDFRMPLLHCSSQSRRD